MLLFGIGSFVTPKRLDFFELIFNMTLAVALYMLIIIFARKTGNGISANTDIFSDDQIIEKVWAISEKDGSFTVKVRFQNGKERIVKMKMPPPDIFKVVNWMHEEYKKYPL